jgi:tyrosyl-tRNA synthetase
VLTVIDALAATGLFPSKKEIRRLVEQGAVRLNGEKFTDPAGTLPAPAPAETIIQAGKRTFVKFVP